MNEVRQNCHIVFSGNAYSILELKYKSIYKDRPLADLEGA